MKAAMRTRQVERFEIAELQEALDKYTGIDKSTNCSFCDTFSTSGTIFNVCSACPVSNENNGFGCLCVTLRNHLIPNWKKIATAELNKQVKAGQKFILLETSHRIIKLCVKGILMRKLSEIAKDISADFTGDKSAYARPYINAMNELSTLDDMYDYDDATDCDDATGIVLRFLCNAQTWRGERARSIKAELKNMLREHGTNI